MKKYKLILLKDLPKYSAGTEVMNISEDELHGKIDYKYRHCAENQNFSEIYDLRNDKEWVRIEEDTKCDCEIKDSLNIGYAVIGYGRELKIELSFKDKKSSEEIIRCRL